MALRQVTCDQAIDFLNELVAKDRQFMTKLVATKSLCNRQLADHPTVQVSDDGKQAVAGFLGVLNGLFGTCDIGPYAGWGPITAEFNDHFELIGFVRTPESNPAITRQA